MSKAVKKTATKKPATKKAAKPAAKKTATKKAATKKAAKPATKKAATKKATAKKPATKKAATKKPATKKAAVKKPAAKAVSSRLPRGYKITKVVRELNLPADIGGKDFYELYEVTGPGVDKPRVFISDETARDFIRKADKLVSEVKAIAGKGHAPVGMRDVVRGTADIMASAELADVELGPKSDRKESKVMYSDSE
jgi:hypothetical protein